MRLLRMQNKFKNITYPQSRNRNLTAMYKNKILFLMVERLIKQSQIWKTMQLQRKSNLYSIQIV